MQKEIGVSYMKNVAVEIVGDRFSEEGGAGPQFTCLARCASQSL